MAILRGDAPIDAGDAPTFPDRDLPGPWCESIGTVGGRRRGVDGTCGMGQRGAPLTTSACIPLDATVGTFSGYGLPDDLSGPMTLADDDLFFCYGAQTRDLLALPEGLGLCVDACSADVDCGAGEVGTPRSVCRTACVPGADPCPAGQACLGTPADGNYCEQEVAS